MRIPLIVLAFLSFFWAFSFNPFDAQSGWLLNSIRQPEASSFAAGHLYVGLLSVALAATGLGLAWRSHRKGLPAVIGAPKSMFKELSIKSFYLDRLYHVFFVNLALVMAALSHRIDSKVIDRIIDKAGKWNVLFANIIAWFDKYIIDGLVNLLAYLAGKLGQLSRYVQGGTIHYYLFWALAGMLGFLLWIIKR
jgi:NADH-quinone oxidoreductase subunit L